MDKPEVTYLPRETEGLLQLLDHLFPHRCPKPTDSDRDIWMYAGRRALVDELIARHKNEHGDA